MLGIESSCDDTGVAVVRASDGAILGQAVTDQVAHSPFLKLQLHMMHPRATLITSDTCAA